MEPDEPRHDPQPGRWIFTVLVVVAFVLLAALLILMIGKWAHV
ncbi:hypothetical protein [Microlunatus aurantiacus]